MNSERLMQMIDTWNRLAKKADDLKFVLLNHGRALGRALPAVQAEYQRADKAFYAHQAAMEKTGAFWFRDQGAPEPR